MKTAVEWLEEKLIEYGFDLSLHKFEIKQAKEMEKQQIIDADINGSFRTAEALNRRISSFGVKELAGQYYNETFNK
jgi:hypothetical protein